MPLLPLGEPPSFTDASSQEKMEEATPSSFASMPPRLVLELDDVLVVMKPVPSSLATDAKEASASGRLWLTEEHLSFLPSDGNATLLPGFQLTYPMVALHAIARSVPEEAQATGSHWYQDACLYSQLDEHPERDADDEEEEEEVHEMWILARDDVSRMYPMLTYL